MASAVIIHNIKVTLNYRGVKTFDSDMGSRRSGIENGNENESQGWDASPIFSVERNGQAVRRTSMKDNSEFKRVNNARNTRSKLSGRRHISTIPQRSFKQA